MEFVNMLEKRVEEILNKMKLPALPAVIRSWLGQNIWWIAAVFAVLSAFGVLFALGGILTSLAAMSALPGSWVVGAVVGWGIVTGIVSLIFSAVDATLLGLAVNPLQLKQKKGWTLLFIVWLVGALSIAVSILLGILALNPFAVIGTVIFGALSLAISGYVLFEIRREFAHVEKSAGVKKTKTVAKAKTKKK